MKIHYHIEDLNDEIIKKGRKKVVFTNGVFDILHPGHIELLEFSRNLGDCLVVGINDDLSVKRLKGDKRPIFPLAERIEILSAVGWVNYIIPFSQDTPLELIKSLFNIKILVKGGDYRSDQVVGKREVEAQGGELVLFPYKSEYSTSLMIQKILS